MDNLILIKVKNKMYQQKAIIVQVAITTPIWYSSS
ncbi:hypothetical protein DFP97_12820 [Paenibacillus prosopidis]|uniref:Uncharacterized protein n=1 Tax=Paenibacillus prosopidis TaxID=630520 RepID=A0A368VKS4_9BACL|nr:hypothetical protein DFP97_12820 [Paenibacillus prosopidis]